jgi:peptidoglycan/LPS O-acetylase OafA/YrhL
MTATEIQGSLQSIGAAFPVSAFLAGVFYSVLVAALVLPPFRRFLKAKIALPAPSDGTVFHVSDVLRGLAALWVACFHAWQWTRPSFDEIFHRFPAIEFGTKAVPVFVVLSGFLIYRAALSVTDRPSLKRYFVRRFFRVYPLYFVSVICAFAVTASLSQDGPGLQDLFSDIFMLRVLGADRFMNPVAWSLYVEIQFYVLLPALVLGFGRHTFTVSLILLAALPLTDFAGPREYALWKYFFAGIVAYEVLRRAQEWAHPLAGRVRAISAPVLLWVGVWLFYLDVFARYDLFEKIVQRISDLLALGISVEPQGIAYQLSVGLGASIVLMLVGGGLWRPLAVVFALYPFRVLAAISYSLFLLHPILLAIDVPVRFVGSGGIEVLGRASGALPVVGYFAVLIPAIICLAAIGFLLVERPALECGRRIADRIRVNT